MMTSDQLALLASELLALASGLVTLAPHHSACACLLAIALAVGADVGAEEVRLAEFWAPNA